MIINTASLLGLYKAFNTRFQSALNKAPTDFEKISMTVPSGTGSNDYAWLANIPMVREWVGDRFIKSISAMHYEIHNKDYEATISVKRNDINDDQIGLYTPMFDTLGFNAKRHPDKLIFDLLKNGFASDCYDGQYFFDTDHEVAGASVSNNGGGSGEPWFLLCTTFPVRPLIFQSREKAKLIRMDKETDENTFMRKEYLYGVDYRGNAGYGLWQLAYGSKDTLSPANYATARAAMMALKNDEGMPLGIVPDMLVAGPTHESAGRSLLEIANNASGAGNPWYKTAKLLITPWLA